jgi:hypothetical protein
MSKFFVGQRVKKVRGNHDIGQVATVVGLVCLPAGATVPLQGGQARLALPCDMQVLPDTSWTAVAGSVFPASQMAYTESWMFEPAHDGNETVSWSECLWQPEPQQVSA